MSDEPVREVEDGAKSAVAASARSGGDPSALPVALVGESAHAEAVRRWVEGVLGWQPVDGGDAQLVPAVVELRDLDSRAPRSEELPSILLVDDDARGERVAHVAARVSPDAVLGWPSGRDRLGPLATEVLERRRPGTSIRGLRLGGSAGGVGTTTVTLALAGLAAWAGARTFAAVRGVGLPLRGMPAAALATPDLWSRADPVVGLSCLRAVVVADGGEVPDLTDRSIDASLFDVGVDHDVDVLVCRPDAAALAALAATTAALVVVVGEGAVTERDLRRAAVGRRVVELPWSARVARVGLQGRVPAGLPGAWLARLRPFLPVSSATQVAPRQRVVHRPTTARRRRRRRT